LHCAGSKNYTWAKIFLLRIFSGKAAFGGGKVKVNIIPEITGTGEQIFD
jgi:hypothetical protein